MKIAVSFQNPFQDAEYKLGFSSLNGLLIGFAVSAFHIVSSAKPSRTGATEYFKMVAWFLAVSVDVAELGGFAIITPAPKKVKLRASISFFIARVG